MLIKIIGVLLIIVGLFALTYFSITKFRTIKTDKQSPALTSPSIEDASKPNLSFKHSRIKLGAQVLDVEVAKTSDQKAQGLSGRKKLSDNEGMLFDFSDEQIPRPTFWMKDMLIGIDIIWIKDFTVVEITKSIPPPNDNTPDINLKRYTPEQDVDSVLEVRSGWSEAYKIKIGETLSY